MPAWIHERAKHILAKNPDMPKSQAFGIATQQSHATGKTPKGYGTKAGKVVAKAKYNAPKRAYEKTPNPEGLKTRKLKGPPKTRWTGSQLVSTKHASIDFPAFSDEVLKIAKKLTEKEMDALAKADDILLEKLIESSPVPVQEVTGKAGIFNLPFMNAAYLLSDKDAKKFGEEYGQEFEGPGIVYGPSFKLPSMLAHEMGHAEIAKGKRWKLVQNKATIAAGNMAPLIGFLAGNALAGKSKAFRRAGVLLPALASAPQLTYEAGASLKGLKRLKAQGASDEQISTARMQLAAAYGTYLLHAGLGPLAYYKLRV